MCGHQYVQAEVNKQVGCRDFQRFCEKVGEMFSNLTRKHHENLFGIMNKMPQQVIDKNGGKTKYYAFWLFGVISSHRGLHNDIPLWFYLFDWLTGAVHGQNLCGWYLYIL